VDGDHRRDDKSVAAAALAFWSALHGFALLRMGGRFKRFMLGALTGDELANAMVAAAVAIVPSIKVPGCGSAALPEAQRGEA
jgi:hypothetical protein